MESPSLCRKGPTTEAEGRIKRDAVSKPEARNKSNAQPLAKKMSTIAFRRHGECASARAQPVHHGGHAAPQEPAYRQAHKPDGAEPHIARGDDRLALAAAKAEIKKATAWSVRNEAAASRGSYVLDPHTCIASRNDKERARRYAGGLRRHTVLPVYMQADI